MKGFWGVMGPVSTVLPLAVLGLQEGYYQLPHVQWSSWDAYMLLCLQGNGGKDVFKMEVSWAGEMAP